MREVRLSNEETRVITTWNREPRTRQGISRGTIETGSIPHHSLGGSPCWEVELNEATGALHHLEHEAAHCGNSNCKTNKVAALRTNLAPSSEPSLVRPAIGGPRIPPRRSLRQAPRFGRAHGCASPEIRVSPPAEAGLVFERDTPGKTKNPPERRLGRVCGTTQMSDSLKPIRSHEPGVHRRTADCRSLV
jgi:hypothetical protein